MICDICEHDEPERSVVIVCGPEKESRTREFCPYHEQMEYGVMHDYYDTRRVFFDCGTSLDMGYGFWQKPRGGKGRRGQIGFTRRLADKANAASDRFHRRKVAS